MKPNNKINAFSLSITTAIVFAFWIIIQNNLINNPTFKNLISNNLIFVSLIGFFTSLGFYRILISILKYIFDNINFLKKLLYWKYFFDGIWVGFFIGKNGEVRLYYEDYKQKIDQIIIKGTSFYDNGTSHATWIARDPLIKDDEDKIIYYYETEAMNNTYINPGFASFDIYRNNFKIPTKLKGFSSDLYNSKKLFSIEEKIHFSKKYLSHENILKKANEIYKKNKQYIPL